MKMKLHGTGTADREPRARPQPDVSTLELSPPFVSRIDEALRAFTGRNLVAATEVADVLLDLRLQVVLDVTLSELCRSAQR